MEIKETIEKKVIGVVNKYFVVSSIFSMVVFTKADIVKNLVIILINYIII